jgi:hypothetical protein
MWVKEVGEGVACSHAAEQGCTGTMEAVYTGPKKFIPAELLAGGCTCAERKARENEAALRAGASGPAGNEAEVPSPEPEPTPHCDPTCACEAGHGGCPVRRRAGTGSLCLSALY